MLPKLKIESIPVVVFFLKVGQLLPAYANELLTRYLKVHIDVPEAKNAR
jgi:hypothetical protein